MSSPDHRKEETSAPLSKLHATAGSVITAKSDFGSRAKKVTNWSKGKSCSIPVSNVSTPGISPQKFLEGGGIIQWRKYRFPILPHSNPNKTYCLNINRIKLSQFLPYSRKAWAGKKKKKYAKAHNSFPCVLKTGKEEKFKVCYLCVCIAMIIWQLGNSGLVRLIYSRPLIPHKFDPGLVSCQNSGWQLQQKQILPH